jgi:hypothetical protein
MRLRQFSRRYNTTKAIDKQISVRHQQTYLTEYREKQYAYWNQEESKQMSKIEKNN